MISKKTQCIIFLFQFFILEVFSQLADPNQTPFAYGISAGVYASSANPKQVSNVTDKKAVAGFSIGGVASFRMKTYFLETGINYLSEGYAYSTYIENKTTYNKVSNEYKFYSIMVPLKLAIPIRSRYGRHLPSLAFNAAFPTKQTLFQSIEYNNAPSVKNVYKSIQIYSIFD